MPASMNRRLPLLGMVLTVALLSACQGSPSVPLGDALGFKLGAVNPQAIAAQGAQVAGSQANGKTAPLTVSVKTSDLVRGLHVLSTVADVDHVLVDVVAADGSEFQATITKAQLTNGQGSATFPAVPVGNATITLKAFDVNGQMIGQATGNATVVANVTTPVSINLTLNPTYSGGGGSSGTPTGGLTVNGTLQNGPVISGTPTPAPTPTLPPTGTVLGSLTFATGDFVGLAVDHAGNAWTVEWTPDAAGLTSGTWKLVEVSPQGTVLASYPAPAYASSLAIDASNNIWISTYIQTQPGQAAPAYQAPAIAGNLYEYSPTGTQLVSVPIQPGESTFAAGSVFSVSTVIDQAGHIWVLVPGPAELVEFDGTGNVLLRQSLATQSSLPACLSVAPAGGMIVGFENGELQLYSSSRLVGTSSIAGVTMLYGMAYDSYGTLWAVDNGTSQLFEIPGGMSQSQFNLNMRNPYAIDVDPQNNLWICDTGNNQVLHVSTYGKVTGTYSFTGGWPQNVKVGAKGAWVVGNTTSSWNGNTLLRCLAL